MRQVSDTLFFIVEGELNLLHENTPIRRIKRDSEVLLSTDKGEELVAVEGVGCIGQEVLLGVRRRNTITAHTKHVEFLIIGQEAMSNLFSKTDSGNLHRISHAVLENFHRRVRLESFKWKLESHKARVNGADDLYVHYAFLIAWRRFHTKQALKSNNLLKIIGEAARDYQHRHDPVGKDEPTSSKSAEEPFSADVGAALERLSQQMKRLEKNQDRVQHEMSTITSHLSRLPSAPLPAMLP